MRNIAVMKPCAPDEVSYLQSFLSVEDRLFFLENEDALLASPYKDEIHVVFGEPEIPLIRKLPNLNWVQLSWAGANQYTQRSDFPQNITLTSASGAFGVVISEYILGGVLALYKNFPAYQKQMQQGKWYTLPNDETLENKRVLILGTGNIGSETAKKMKVFGANTVGLCKHPKKAPGFDVCRDVSNLEEELTLADCVVCALPGTKETSGLLGKAQLNRMKTDSVFVNVGRGAVVDTNALTDVLNAGKIRGAVLDVFHTEPLPADHPLRNMENVIVTPHVSGISWGNNCQTRRRILEIFGENLKRHARNLPLDHIIDFQKGY